ncbi:Uncharacterized protein SCF082_LOCUS14128 [Durusdinium trenchii]|uniref:Uncharacterized protein n=1 Tax=Durusdinium trenchii TaxID=1381693 RepID=A0ABP0JVL7_9DINO
MELLVDSDEEPKEVQGWVLLPHEFSSCLLANYSEESILKFWQHIKTLDDWKRHGVVHNMSNDKLRKLIPVNIHRDGAEVFTDNEYFVWSWSSTFAEFGQTTKDVLMKKYPIAIVAESEMQNLSVRKNMEKVVAEITAWSLRHGASGVAPMEGFYGEQFPKRSFRSRIAGKPLACGYRLCYLAFKADLKARAECNYFYKRYYRCKTMCDRCDCIQPTTNAPEALTYKDFRDVPAYSGTSVGSWKQ